MSAAFSSVSVLGSSLVLLFGLVLLWRRSIRAHITAFTWQSLALAGLAGTIAYFSGERELYLVAALLLAVKGVGIPWLLRRMETRFGAERELDPYLNTATSILISGLLVLLATTVTRPLVAVSQLPTRSGMPLAMALVFVSLFIVVSRKKALTQVIGFLMLENGIGLLAVLGAYGIPLVVELGVFLDLLMGLLVMQIFIYQIHETFESIDVEQLSRLKD
jgi:hydrogenase-4 component E